MDSPVAGVLPSLAQWISSVNHSVQNGYGTCPLFAYGTDWPAFGHAAIAVAFIGPLRDPVKNIWVLEFGMIACLPVIPRAVIFGIVRIIPAFWMLIDISFGLLCIILLWHVRREVLALSPKWNEKSCKFMTSFMDSATFVN